MPRDADSEGGKLTDEIKILMGLMIKCAHCHTHKYATIPQPDYYRMKDVFKGAYDEQDWLNPHSRSLHTSAGRARPIIRSLPA